MSKTINFRGSASIEEIKAAYMAAWEMGCKGITVYRDGSKDFQVLQTSQLADSSDKKAEKMVIQSKLKVKTLKQRASEGLGKLTKKNRNKCPECGGSVSIQEGCSLCHECGWSACSS